MKFGILGLVGVLVAGGLVLETGCHPSVDAATGLSQAEAEQLTGNIYIKDCHPPQPGLTRTVVVGKPNPNGHIREQYGSVMVYPVEVTWTGSCSGHPVNPGQTDFYSNVKADYTASYYKDQFGKWQHTPFIGSCSRTHSSYQPNGSATIAVPGAPTETCGPADTIND